MNETIAYYNNHAREFVNNTINVDMSEIQKKFMYHIPQGGLILDLGCGSGRDSKVFLEHGYNVEAIDGSANICRIASEFTGLQVKNIIFENIDYIDRFDGIWACASLLHIQKKELPEILKKINIALSNNGVLYASFKHGEEERRVQNRIFSDFTECTATKLFCDAGFIISECFVTCDKRKDREEEKWVNIFAKSVI